MDNQAKLSAAIAKEGTPAADAAMTGVMNAMGQGGDFSAGRMPIKNRINALDVSNTPCLKIEQIRLRQLLIVVATSLCLAQLERSDQAAE